MLIENLMIINLIVGSLLMIQFNNKFFLTQKKRDKKASGVDISTIAKNLILLSLKSDVNKIDKDKLKTNTVIQTT